MRRCSWIAGLSGVLLMMTAGMPGHAQPASHGIRNALAPTGTLRVGIWMLGYFAVADSGSGRLKGVVPDLAEELARRLGVPAALVRFDAPGGIVAAFRNGTLDVTFLGVTADRAEAMAFGPTLLDLQASFLVPARSAATGIADMDRPGMRIVVPQRSAQEAHLRKTLVHATIATVPPEAPLQAIDLIARGEADAFSHVVPMLASVQASLPGSRLLPGSYFNVPVAIASPKGRPDVVADYCRRFVEDVKASGFVREAIARAGVPGLAVSGD